MKGFARNLILGALVAVALFSSLSFAETTCSRSGCDITITLKMAFAGADSGYINRSTSEIESFWNGPSGYRYAGDCKCTITMKVETTTAVDCKNNRPQGYHCIDVTKYFTPDKSAYDNPPRNQTEIAGAELYIGYVYGIAKGNGGNSELGWFSDIMSRPVDPNNASGRITWTSRMRLGILWASDTTTTQRA